jgi:hypothetical protein
MRYLPTLLLAAFVVFAASCSQDQVEDPIGELFIDVFGKTLSQNTIDKRNAYCSANPNDSKCSRWCADPQSNCDGTPPPPPPDPCDEDPTLPECDDNPPPPPPGDGDMLDVNGTWAYESINVPVGSKICIIGYSNTAQWGSGYVSDLQARGYVAVNAALGSNALENWAANPSLLDRCGSAPDLILSQVSSQANVTNEAGVANQIRTYLPQLHANIRSKFPNAIVAHFQGEAAHYVDPAKRWGIREPSRYLHGKYIVEVVSGLTNAVPGPYMWTDIGASNLSTQCGTWTQAMNTGPNNDNQHPSDLGKQFMSCQANDWFDKYVN